MWTNPNNTCAADAGAREKGEETLTQVLAMSTKILVPKDQVRFHTLATTVESAYLVPKDQEVKMRD